TEGRRGRRRPRKGYMDNIEQIATKRGSGIGELRRTVKESDLWRKRILAGPTL
ncbi:hypothetical protein L9F63_003026, partial [Diploptera punctata]